MTQIVATVTARDMTALVAARDAVRDADMVELRLDGVAEVDVRRALAGRRLPALVTCRTVRDGGRHRGPDAGRAALLRQAVEAGAEFVDVEWNAEACVREAVPVDRQVLSLHCVDGAPDDLVEQARAMAAVKPAVVKVAYAASRLGEVRLALALSEALEEQRHVVIAMGPSGLVTRVHPAWLGSAWTYGGSAAPGQLPVSRLARSFRVRSTSAASRLYGVAGAPVAHSASPAMHNAMFASRGLDAVYAPFECADAAELFDMAPRLGVCGMSVTAPLKPGCAERVAAADDTSRRVGAVNTLRWRDGRAEGANFDVAGFLAPLDARRWAARGRTAVVLGAGGAARAAVVALLDRGATVRVAARRRQSAVSLAAALGVETAPWPPEPGWDLLVNATPAGTHPRPGETPIDADRVRGGLVYDLVYNPADTALMRAAAAHGVPAVGGLEMLVAQAARQFEWWTGQPADTSLMTTAASEFLAEAS